MPKFKEATMCTGVSHESLVFQQILQAKLVSLFFVPNYLFKDVCIANSLGKIKIVFLTRV